MIIRISNEWPLDMKVTKLVKIHNKIASCIHLIHFQGIINAPFPPPAPQIMLTRLSVVIS